jgi:ABC-type Fe3+-siderophore transport system permease subunit
MLWAASFAVIVASTLASFRLGFADDLPTLLRVNGPRVLFGGAVGGLLALSGALRLGAGAERPLRELELFALSTGAAGAGFLCAGGAAGAAALVRFGLGAAVGALLFWALVRGLDRKERWTNLGAAAVLVTLTGVAALAGTYARARRDLVAPAVAWLLGDLSGASVTSGLAVLIVGGLLLFASLRTLRTGAGARPVSLALIALGVGVGAAGPLAFVGAMAPRTVRWLGSGAPERTLLPLSVAAGAATVVAIDAVPRLLVGGYDFPFNVPAAMLAIPIFLGWNRARLRREAGAAGLAFEGAEIALLAGLTLVGVWLAVILSGVIHSLT